jgi:hypothetical protein
MTATSQVSFEIAGAVHCRADEGKNLVRPKRVPAREGYGVFNDFIFGMRQR